MAREIRLPQLGQTMEEGTIVDCTVKVGDEVKKGDVIFEVETDKATLEMESPADGFVKHVLAEVGQTLPVGEAILVLGDKDEEVPQSFLNSLKVATTAELPPAVSTAGVEPAKPQPTKKTPKIIASPRAKKLAKELGVVLATVAGTGPAGRITEQDVEKAASPKPAIPAPAAAEVKLGTTIPLNKLQKLIAKRMLKSKHEIPCFYLSAKADVTNLVELRAKLNQTSDVKVSYNDFIMRAVAIGLQEFPIMTGQPVGDTIKLANTINIGLAVSAPNGLVVLVVKNAHKKDVKQIAADTKALIEKAQDGKLLLTDLEGACITISNLGAFGIESFIPIVVPGQCSIVGVGRITNTCMTDNGKGSHFATDCKMGPNIVIRKLMSLTLSVDHKVADGAYAAQFLDFVRKLLEDTSTFV